MRFKMIGGVLGLFAMLSVSATVLADTHHSAAWYRAHRHSAAWYRAHRRHNAAWYRAHRRHSAAWHRPHPHG